MLSCAACAIVPAHPNTTMRLSCAACTVILCSSNSNLETVLFCSWCSLNAIILEYFLCCPLCSLDRNFEDALCCSWCGSVKAFRDTPFDGTFLHRTILRVLPRVQLGRQNQRDMETYVSNNAWKTMHNDKLTRQFILYIWQDWCQSKLYCCLYSLCFTYQCTLSVIKAL